MPSTRNTLTFGVFQSAVYDTIKGFTWFVFGIGATLVAPPLQELTGTSWLGAMGWILLGWVVLSFGFVLVYGRWVEPRRADAVAVDQPFAGKVFVWRVDIAGREPPDPLPVRVDAPAGEVSTETSAVQCCPPQFGSRGGRVLRSAVSGPKNFSPRWARACMPAILLLNRKYRSRRRSTGTESLH